ncbi:unnamed protein product [Rangifer tarandus platyrhynchus]|uniref:Uncharacterized protein n=2 Tax=Rangifer tarandus platyrhynchus TaxID=3082113 RepID=A0AC59YY49_RANTA|nr:unnamed protein product [Rangifer tarandus platyrhynchus]
MRGSWGRSFQLWCSESPHRTCPHPAQPPGTPAFRAWAGGKRRGRKGAVPQAQEPPVSLSSVLSGPTPGMSTYEESSLSPGFTEEEGRHGWPTVHRLPGAKSSSDHPRTLPPNSSAANQPLTPDLWAHLPHPAVCEELGNPQKLRRCRRCEC